MYKMDQDMVYMVNDSLIIRDELCNSKCNFCNLIEHITCKFFEKITLNKCNFCIIGLLKEILYTKKQEKIF